MNQAPNKTQFEKKLAAYALASAAVLAAPGSAAAGIVSFNVNQTVTQTGSYALNLSGPASADITISAELDPYITTFNNVNAHAITGAGVLLSNDSPSTAAALAFGALIDPTATGFGSFGKMVSSFGSFPGDWSLTGGDAYLGFYFTSDGVHAGWAHIATTDTTYPDTTAASFTLLSYGYDTEAATTVTAGQGEMSGAPEPSSMALLALGGAGLLALRRRRSAHA